MTAEIALEILADCRRAAVFDSEIAEADDLAEKVRARAASARCLYGNLIADIESLAIRCRV
jgi:hypothetical protein